MKSITTSSEDDPSYLPLKSTPNPSSTSPSSSSPLSYFSSIPKRYIMCALILLSNILCYADRTNISIAVLPGNIPLTSEFQTGQVLAGFFYGYIFTQFIGGLLAKRYGGKVVLLVGVTVWIVCDALTVPASSVFPVLMLARVGMGLGEGVNFPADHAMVAAWFVQEERSGLLSIISAGVDIGTIVSSGLSPIIASRLGWQWIYGIYCVIGLCWLTAFALLGSSKPEWHSTITPEERAYILANRSSHPTSSSSAPTPVPWRALLTSASLWGIIAAHVCFNYGFYVMLSWLPKYYVSRGTSLADGGFFSISLPYIAGAIGSPVAGYWSNSLIHRGHRIRSVRILMNTIGSVGASTSMFIIAFYPPQSTGLGTAVLSLGYFFFRFSFSGYWANMVDIGHDQAGEIMGISNTLATIPGMVGNTLTGWILDATGNWSFVFFLAGAAYVLAGVSFYWLCDDVDIGERVRKEKEGGVGEEWGEGHNGEGEIEVEEEGERGWGEERAINVGRARF